MRIYLLVIGYVDRLRMHSFTRNFNTSLPICYVRVVFVGITQAASSLVKMVMSIMIQSLWKTFTNIPFKNYQARNHEIVA